MPNFVAPRKSGAHRIAAIALYRALLTKCNKTTAIPPEQRLAILNVIRKKFKQNAYLTSKHLLKDAFVAGHEALDTLHTLHSAPNPTLQHLLARTSHPTTPPSPPSPPQAPPLNSHYQNSALAPRPRPHTALGGTKIRRIPVLVSANKIPFLRYKKPQPLALSMYFKARMAQRQRLHDRRWELLDQAALARTEDEWDREIEGRMRMEVLGRAGGGEGEGVGREEMEEGTWEGEIEACLKEVSSQLNRESEKNRVWASRMVKIVDEEKRLAEEERKQRVMAKNLRHRERKRMREMGEGKESLG